MNEELHALAMKFADEVVRNREKILEDFFKAYLAVNIPRYGVGIINDLQLVEIVDKRLGQGSRKWYFELKPIPKSSEDDMPTL